MIAVKVSYDKNIFNEAREFIDEAIKDELIRVGRFACEDAKLTKEYQNRTHDLVNAYGFGVVLHGKLVHSEVLATSNQHVIGETLATINDAVKGMDIGLILANGKFYASFVESKGYLVMSNSAIKAKNELNNK